jgi:hypothetical protein
MHRRGRPRPFIHLSQPPTLPLMPPAIRLVAVALVLAASAAPALAHGFKIPAFARKYGVSCSVCHAPVPKLTAAGEAFAGNGFEFEPGEEPRDTVATGDALLRLQKSFPLAVRFDAYLTALSKTPKGQATTDLQSPWVVKLLSGGQVAHKVSYYTYFLMTERGEVGGLEDAYIQFTDIKNSGISLILGQFQVSDPLFKREVRLSYDDYQPYRLRVGNARADLTYDRGLMATWSPWEGGDLVASLVSGRGLNQADDQRQYDLDNGKNFALRYSQDIGSKLRLGVYGYGGTETQASRQNQISVLGADATISLSEKAEVNFQHLIRRDDDPFYGTCSVAAPCPGGRTRAFSTDVTSTFAEVILSPKGPAGRVFFSGLYNRISSADGQVVSLRLGEQATAPGFLEQYQTVSGAAHFVYRRNLRMMGEVIWDLEQKSGRMLVGIVSAF